MRQPEFILYTGPMFASKTTKLISALERFKRKGLNVLAFKPSLDTRFSVAQIVTHNGASLHANCISHGMELNSFVNQKIRDGQKIDVIGVDEAFMIPEIGRSLVDWYRRGITIVVSSIQMSASLEPFAEISYMMPWATQIDVSAAICTECDQDAYLTAARFDIIDAEKPCLGGAELYIPLCHTHLSKLRAISSK